MSGKLYCVHDLELVLDPDRHHVTRGTRPFVDLGGNCRLWEILTKLCSRYDSYYPAKDLRAEVWEDDVIEDGTLWGAVSDLRKLLLPLEITIKHRKGCGYRLEEMRARTT